MRAPLCCYRALRLRTLVIALVVLDGTTGRPSDLHTSTARTVATSAPEPTDQHKHLFNSIKDSFMNSIEKLKGKRQRVTNSTYSVAEKREHIRKYKKHLEDKHALDKFYEKDDGIDGDAFTFTDTGLIGETEGQWLEGHLPDVYFSLDVPHPHDPKRETVVTSAKLNLFKLPALAHAPTEDGRVHNDRHFSTVNIYQLLKPTSNESRPARKLLHSRSLSNNSGWESFDLTDVVKHWLQYPGENYGLAVVPEVTKHGPRFYTRKFDVRHFASKSKSTGGCYPSLKIDTKHRHILGRAKRAPERYDCKVGDGERRCCRYPLWVAFKDIGWDDWVVAPEGYQAYYCDGACPDRYKPANNFAGIKSILHMINPRSVPQPCCTASKTDSLDLLHYDEHDNLIVTEYEGMIVQDCKCA